MLKFTDLMRFPGQFAKRESSIYQINIELAKADDTPQKIIFGSITQSKQQHGQKIEAVKIDGKLSLQSPVQIQCSCQSFKYEFAGPLLRIDSLLEKEYYEYAIKMNKPKKKNVNQLAGGCKHIIKLSRLIWSKQTLPNFGLVKDVMRDRKYMMASQQVSMNNYNPRDPYQKMDRQELLKKQRAHKRAAARIM